MLFSIFKDMDRLEGYYWVKYRGRFRIAFYQPNIPKGWSLINSTASYEDSDFEHINEHRIKEPGELPD